jgi:hypothetical protein
MNQQANYLGLRLSLSYSFSKSRFLRACFLDNLATYPCSLPQHFRSYMPTGGRWQVSGLSVSIILGGKMGVRRGLVEKQHDDLRNERGASFRPTLSCHWRMKYQSIGQSLQLALLVAWKQPTICANLSHNNLERTAAEAWRSSGRNYQRQ